MLVADSSTVQEGVELDEIGVVLWCCGAVVLVTAGAECDSSSSKSENSSSGVQRHYRILACRRFSC